ncbi:MAG: diaminopimelate epimerase [Proteobacteria bacterium]|nr:diaminopimelate epimerase [Pseudomonadota bacterium]
MLIRFTKMHGLGNDFVLLDLITQSLHLREDQIRALADRRQGIGFDQLLTVEPPRDPNVDFRYRIYNADGTEAEQCGNGARCFTRFVRDRGLTTKTRITLETRNGNIECKLEKDGLITVNMGPPRLEPDHIPFRADHAQITYSLEVPRQGLIADPCEPETVCISAINVGNPHAVLVVPDVSTAPVEKLGRLIESHDRFPERVNVNFMQIISRSEIALRVFERGVGETLACGTGACASVVAGRLQGLMDERVEVRLPGGQLCIRWEGNDTDIYMTGAASRVYEGRLQI